VLERGHGLTDYRFGGTMSINIGGVKKVNTLIKCMMNLFDRIFLVNRATIGEPATKGYFRNLDATLA
jgi:hypothetical protein